MDHGTEDRPRNAAKAAEELARLAASSRNPEERLWFLQWAQAFRQLAAFGERGLPDDGRREDLDDGWANRG